MVAVENITDTVCVYKDDPFKEVKIFNFSLTVCIGLFGLISNSMVVAINRRIRTLTSTDIFITLLAIVDNLMILSVSLVGFRYVYIHLMQPEDIDLMTSGLISLYGILLKNFVQPLNTYTIVLLNIDRYLKVKYLAKARTCCTPRKAMLQLLAVAFGSAMFCVPKIVSISAVIIQKDKTINQCTGFFKISAADGLGQDKIFHIVYRWILYIVVLYAVPLTILIFTSATLISTLCHRRRWLCSLQAEPRERIEKEHRLKKNEVSAIISLVAVTIVFMACQIPDVVLQFIWKLARKHGPTASMITYQIVILNSSVNFIIYALSSSVFRRRLKKMFRREPKLPNISTSSTT